MPAFLLVAVLAPPAAAEPMVLRAEPAHVLLRAGQPAQVELTLTVPGAEPELVLRSTAGTVQKVERVAPGKYRAVLLRPEEGFPQLAVITAADVAPVWRGEPPRIDSTVVSFSAAIDLAGRTEAGATMRVEVGGKVFGPVGADGTGRFVLPIVVPPGESFGKGVSTDALGNRARSQVNLYLPEVRRLHFFVYPEVLVADGADRAWIFVTTVSPAGAPEDRKITVKPARGVAGPPERLGTGIWRVPYRAPTTLDNGEDPVSIAVPGIVPDVLRLPLLADRPVALEGRVPGAPVPADGSTTAELLVTARDARKNPATGHRVTVQLAEAELPCMAREPGVCAVALSPRAIAGLQSFDLALVPESAACPRARRTPDGRVVDARGVLCPAGAAASVTVLGQTVAGAVSGEAAVTWRLPAPIDLRIIVEERAAAGVRLRVEAAGVRDPSARLMITAERGSVQLVESKLGAMKVMVKAGAGRVVAADKDSGVSAWTVVE